MTPERIYDILHSLYGEPGCPLAHETPFQLLCAVMLSAQCRDERVNQITPRLFALAPDAASLAALEVPVVAELIRTCGLFQTKSRNLVACARRIVADFGGEVPRTMAELLTLPGIGRKSANVLLGNAFGLPGFPVDTHVNRVLNRLGTVKTSAPEKIEACINAAVAPERWCNFSHLLIQHGRRVCHARAPECRSCPFAPADCRFFQLNQW